VPRRLLAFHFLRHLRLRDLRQRLLGILNYMRSVQRRLTIDVRRLPLRATALDLIAWLSESDLRRRASPRTIARPAARSRAWCLRLRTRLD
jgi:hypothetical protein